MYAPAAALRPERPKLKCKNGCDYFGNPQWDGYCSKCYRELRQRQQEASATSPIESSCQESERSAGGATKCESRGKSVSPLTPSFSRFEEKRLRQTDTLKKTNILKFNVFRKNNTADENEKESTASSTTEAVPKSVYEGFSRDVSRRVRGLGAPAERDLRHFLKYLIQDVLRHAHVSTEQLSERIQYLYQLLMKRMESVSHYSHVDEDTRETLIDLVEKHAMTFLYDRVLSWSEEREERADRSMQAHIRRLGWVRAAHLDCRIDHDTQKRRQLLYDATDELLTMDTRPSPGGKLSSVRRCCACVVALVSDCVGAPASADDLLPALIFTVLKANPPRLVSNINYVTRFSNASRLMTGEKGYYFTNLCCAVSFIEKLGAESLGMAADEFECYMNMPACIGSSSWTAALGVCERSRRGAALRGSVRELTSRVTLVQEQATQLQHSSRSFYDEIEKKTVSLLERTPLQVKQRVPPHGVRYLLPHPASATDQQGSITEVAQSVGDLNTEDVNKTKQSLVSKQEALNANDQVLVSIEDWTTPIDAITVSPEPLDELDKALTELEEPLARTEESPARTPASCKSEDFLIPVQEALLQTSLDDYTPVKAKMCESGKGLSEEDSSPEAGQQPPPLANVHYDLDLSDLSDAPNILDDSPHSSTALPPPILPNTAK